MQKYNFFSNICYVEKYFFHKAYLTISISNNRLAAMQVKILFILRCKNSYVSNNANEFYLLWTIIPEYCRDHCRERRNERGRGRRDDVRTLHNVSKGMKF